MSKTIEQKVVEMRFDNKQFESNVQTSMSTIDKLKQKLDFTGASKGLENVSSAAKKIDMNGLGTAVENVRLKFSALEVMGVTALANITNSAINAGKRVVSALTLDPIVTGFQEYETQINAVQTILANTQSKGSTLDDVNAALDELNKYADQTIYNFTEMTRNIGTFTAAGVELDKSVTSIKGIANLAAVSGSNAQQASTAMYQLSQALAAGRVSLMDWNSVVNAGMGGELFQNALIRTAQNLGTGVDEAIEKYGTFRESLTKGQWLTAEVLTETLTQLSGAYSEADLIAQGYSEKQAKEITELATTAVDAATKVKTFTQLWDTMKEAAQSGWTQTWEIVIGDFEEAKELLTRISDAAGAIINESSERRNKLLEGALGNSESKWASLTEQITVCGISSEQFEARIKEVAIASGMTAKEFDDIIEKNGSLAKAFEKGALPIKFIKDAIKSFADGLNNATKPVQVATDQLEYFNKVVGQVIRGNFGNGEERIKKLTEAGYDNVAVQKLVNKIWERNGKTWDNVTLTSEELTEVIGNLSVEEMKSIGYTEEQAAALKELAKQAEETGTPLDDLINSFNKPSGRELLISSFENVLGSLYKAIMAVSKAWTEIFPPMTSTQLYNIIEAIHNFTEGLVLVDEDAEKITRTFKGLFAILDIITTILGSGFKLAFNVLTSVLGAFNMDVLDFTALMGDAAVNLRNFLLDNEIVANMFVTLANGAITAAKAIKEWIESFFALPSIQNAIDKISNGFDKLKEVGQNAIAGFREGLEEGLHSIPELLMNIGRALLDAIKNILGIHSPSTEMKAIGEFTIQGFLDGLSAGASMVLSWFQNLANMVIASVRGVNWSYLVAAAISAGLLVTVKNFVDVLGALTAPLQGVGDVLSGFGDVLSTSAKSISKVFKGLSKVLNAKAFSIRADAVKTLAISIAILAASLFVLSRIDWQDLLKAGVALIGLAAVITLLSVAVGKWGPENTLKFAGFGAALVAMAASMAIASAALKILDTLNPDKYVQTITAFGAIILAFAAIIASFGLLVKADASGSISKVGGMMLKMSIAIMLMVAAIKLISLLSDDEITRGAKVIGGVVGIMVLLGVATRIGGQNISGFSNTMLAFSASILLMVAAVKGISGLSDREIEKGIVAIVAFTGIIAALALISKLWKQAKGLGATLFAISASMLIMVAVVKLASMLSINEIAKGIVAMTAFGLLIAVMTAATKNAKGMLGLAATLLTMSVSIAILAGICIVLSLIDINGLIKGITAVGLLSIFVSLMTKATKGAEDVKGTLIGMAIAIGIIAASVAALSFIDPAKLAGATAAMSVLMGMFSLILLSSKNVNASIGTLIVMSVAIGLIGGIVYVLSGLPIENVLSTAAALSVLLLSLSTSLAILGKAGSVSIGASVALVAITLAIAGIAGVMILLDKMDVEPSIVTAAALSTLLLAMSAVTLILSRIGPAATGAIQGAAAMAAVIGIIAALVLAAGGIAQIPGAKWLAEEGGDFLQAIGTAIGQFIGGIAGGVLEGATSTLPDVAKNLSSFMTELEGFISGANTVTPETLEGVKNIALMILTLTGANIINGISQLFGVDSFDTLGEKLVSFGEAMASFGDTIKGHIDPESANAAASVGNMLASLNKSLPKQGGLLQDFLGSQDLNAFSDDMVAFGGAVVAFSDIITPGGKSKVNQEAVEAAANAGLTIAELNNSLPKQGGVLQDFLGEQDLGVFSEDMEAFGKAIVTFSETVAPGGVSAINTEAIAAAANAGQMLSDLNSTLPKQGGVLQDFLGSQNFETFGSQLVAFGNSIVAFSETVSGDGAIDATAIENAKNAGQIMADLNNNLPETDGILSEWFGGTMDLQTFGSQLESFGTSLKSYSDSVIDITPDTVTASANAVDALVNVADKLSGIETDGFFTSVTGLDDFGSQLSKFGAYFYEYYEQVSGINTYKLSTVVTAVDGLVDMAKGMESVDTSSMASFGKDLGKLAKTGIDEFINAFDNAGTRVSQAATDMLTTFIDSANANQTTLSTTFSELADDALTAISDKEDKFGSTAEDLVTQLGEGAKRKKSTATDAFVQIVSETSNEIRKKYDSFSDAGTYLVDGFAAGIQKNSWKAVNQAKALANAVASATRNALDINSPSRVFYGIGNYTVLGLVNGMRDQFGSVENTSTQLGSRILNSVKDFLGIHSPSVVMRDEVGLYIVKGIAEGITEDTSAEQAASQKAQNIVSAFQTEFDKIDLTESISSLERELATALNGGVVSDEFASENENLLRQIESQSKRVGLANAEYQATLQMFGPDSQSTTEAYKKLLEEQIELANYVNELNSLRQEQLETQSQANKDALKAYNQYIIDYSQGLLNAGFTMDEIQAAARSETGYNPNAVTSKLGQLDLDEIMANAMKNVVIAFEDSAETTTQTLVAQSTDIGSSMATAVGTGIQNGTTGVAETTTEMVQTCATKIKEQQPAWVEAATYLVEGFILGIRNNVEAAAAEAAAMANAAYSAAMKALDAHSPSRKFMQVGSYVALGFARGIDANASEVGDSANSMAQTAIKNTKNTISALVDAINSDIDTQPTIRPVLDLSDMESGVSSLNTMFSRNRAMTISTNMGRTVTEDTEGGQTDAISGPTYQFTQNNYSPKALSRIEIYRQTKNLVSASERMGRKK